MAISTKELSCNTMSGTSVVGLYWKPEMNGVFNKTHNRWFPITMIKRITMRERERENFLCGKTENYAWND